jgi:hypothetical protein
MRNSSLLILEIIWIVTGILSAGAGIRSIIISDRLSNSLIFAAMAVIAFLFAWIRHRQRNKS